MKSINADARMRSSLWLEQIQSKKHPSAYKQSFGNDKSDWIEVLMPSAAMAVTRHHRDRSVT